MKDSRVGRLILVLQKDGAMYIQKVLSNGIRVVAEKIPYVQSVSLGVWVANGSRCEKKSENGISHFIEHMLFKGTEKRTAEQIALEMDSVGGQLNAFTTRECTCFYAKTLGDYVENAVDILSDMIFCPELSQKNMELERSVVLEEISMYEDSPEDVVYDLFTETVWGDTPMGRTILGTPETLAAITPESMREYMRTHYTSQSIVIAAAGCFDEDFFELLEKYFGNRDIADNEVVFEPAEYKKGNASLKRDFEQVQLVAGFKGIDIYDESVYALLVFNNIFGSGMSSRLFQNIREKNGLAYSIGAGHSAYVGTGTFDISAATSVENAELVAELIVKEVKKIKREKISAEEIERSKKQLRGNYILSNESVGARMQSIGRTELLKKPLRTPDEVIQKIMEVDADAAADIIDRILDVSTLSVALAGPVDSPDKLFVI